MHRLDMLGTVEYLQLSPPFSYCHFATLNTIGLNSVFDIMRYDRASIINSKTIEEILDSCEDGLSYINQKFKIDLQHIGDKVESWTPGRLLSTQRYVFTAPRHKILPHKYRSSITITGDLEFVLNVMFKNNAFPADQEAVSDMSMGLADMEKSMTVRLGRITRTKEEKWLL